jgi:hypothetical protein
LRDATGIWATLENGKTSHLVLENRSAIIAAVIVYDAYAVMDGTWWDAAAMTVLLPLELAGVS